MPARNAFEYATIRIVPRVERGEFINVGVVLFCRTRRYLAARIEVDSQRLAVFAPGINVRSIDEQLQHIPLVCRGGRDAGPIGELPQHERFRWIVAPRSTIIQPSPPHGGSCIEPAQTLERLFDLLVRVPTVAAPVHESR